MMSLTCKVPKFPKNTFHFSITMISKNNHLSFLSHLTLTLTISKLCILLFFHFYFHFCYISPLSVRSLWTTPPPPILLKAHHLLSPAASKLKVFSSFKLNLVVVNALTPQSIVIGVVFLVIGLFVCFFGYRFWRWLLFFSGFAAFGNSFLPS